MTGGTNPREALRRAGAARARSQERLRAAVLAAVGAGVTEVEAARLAQVDRTTVRRWRGKG